MGLTRLAQIAALGATLCTALPATAGSCRQALALGLDVSGSVDVEEYRLQLDGLAAAFSHPDVVSVLLSQGTAPVRILVYEWSGPRHQTVIADWREISSEADILALATGLRAQRRTPSSPDTALGTAIATGARLLAQQPDCWKRTLDISGDGMSNTGPRPQDIGHLPDLRGIIVNALAIGSGDGGTLATASDLSQYFERIVIRGPGAFVQTADGFDAFEKAMVLKLLRELEGLIVGSVDGSTQTSPTPQ